MNIVGGEHMIATGTRNRGVLHSEFRERQFPSMQIAPYVLHECDGISLPEGEEPVSVNLTSTRICTRASYVRVRSGDGFGVPFHDGLQLHEAFLQVRNWIWSLRHADRVELWVCGSARWWCRGAHLDVGDGGVRGQTVTR